MKKIFSKTDIKNEHSLNRDRRHRMKPEERLQITDALREEYINTFLKEDECGFKRVFKSCKMK